MSLRYKIHLFSTSYKYSQVVSRLHVSIRILNFLWTDRNLAHTKSQYLNLVFHNALDCIRYADFQNNDNVSFTQDIWANEIIVLYFLQQTKTFLNCMFSSYPLGTIFLFFFHVFEDFCTLKIRVKNRQNFMRHLFVVSIFFRMKLFGIEMHCNHFH